MSLRCGCAAEGDETVFGPAHECSLPERTAMPGDALPPLPSCAYPADAEPLYRHVLDSADLDPGEG